MHERTRYRVSGSLFLVALAVILLPMLFDGTSAPVSEIPPPPQASAAKVPKVPVYEDIVPITDVVAQVSKLKDEVDDEGFETTSGTRFGEPQLNTENEDTDVWAVQAGSFAQQQNALDFRLQLRSAGYEAFVSTAKDLGSESVPTQVHRVAIGPLLSRQDAADISAQITRRFNIEPRIVEMTP